MCVNSHSSWSTTQAQSSLSNIFFWASKIKGAESYFLLIHIFFSVLWEEQDGKKRSATRRSSKEVMQQDSREWGWEKKTEHQSSVLGNVSAAGCTSSLALFYVENLKNNATLYLFVHVRLHAHKQAGVVWPPSRQTVKECCLSSSWKGMTKMLSSISLSLTRQKFPAPTPTFKHSSAFNIAVTLFFFLPTSTSHTFAHFYSISHLSGEACCKTAVGELRRLEPEEVGVCCVSWFRVIRENGTTHSEKAGEDIYIYIIFVRLYVVNEVEILHSRVIHKMDAKITTLIEAGYCCHECQVFAPLMSNTEFSTVTVSIILKEIESNF